MIPSTISICVILLTVNICFTIADHHKTDQVSKTSRVTSSTSEPEGTTRGPHTHEEHPEDDPDHSDHTHEEELKVAAPSEEDHEHLGHDHSETGHDHAEDHPEEDPKLSLSAEEPQKDKEVPKVGETKGNRARRGLWRRGLN